LGFIAPVCASGKNIRDDSGYWQQVEVYVSDHREAEFSHSLCPECMKLSATIGIGIKGGGAHRLPLNLEKAISYHFTFGGPHHGPKDRYHGAKNFDIGKIAGICLLGNSSHLLGRDIIRGSPES
jgi:hypothetical protein